MRVASIDLGTVSSRLLVAEVPERPGAPVEKLAQGSAITNMGESVDADGRFDADTVRRVTEACRGFLATAREKGAERVSVTLTSAARDASNTDELLAAIRMLGLEPQVIPGQVEARLTFLGTAADFAGQQVAVADSGGGSTEIACGALRAGAAGPVLDLGRVESLQIGCRRATDRFLAHAPALPDEVEAARAWARSVFAGYWDGLPASDRPDRLVAVGGTVTTLVALTHRLEPYDPAFVHLRDLMAGEVEAAVELMASRTPDEVAALPGVQPKRARVMLGGALVIEQLMAAGGYDRLTVSENGQLVGLVRTVAQFCSGHGSAVGWEPVVTRP